MNAHEVRELLVLAGKLFPNVGFPNRAEAEEWTKSLSFADFADAGNALRAYWKEPGRKESRPRIGPVLARLNGQKPRDNTNLSHAEILAAIKGDDKFRAVVRAYRQEWFQYATSLNARMNDIGEGDGAVRARKMALRQAEGFRRRCKVGVVGCLIGEGVTERAAVAWANTIFHSTGDFNAALVDLDENGMEVAAQTTQRSGQAMPFIDIFKPMPTSRTSYEALKEMAEKLLPEFKAEALPPAPAVMAVAATDPSVVAADFEV